MKYRLGELLTIKHGYPFKGEYFSNTGNLIILTPANFYEEGGFKYTPGKEKYYTSDFPDEYMCKKGDLIVAMTQQAEGLLGSTAFVPEDNVFLHNQRIGLIKTDETKLIPEYADYLFRTLSVRKQIRGSASGTKVKHTSPEKIYDVVVDIPDIEKQRKISNLLRLFEVKIHNNLKLIDDLESLQRLIYSYWFVQYDFPSVDNKTYKSNGGNMIWSELMNTEIPIGWDVKNLLDIVSWEGTSQPPKSCFIYKEKKDYIRFIQNRDYEDSKHKTYIPVQKAIGTCDRYDILVDKYGDAGKVRYGLAGAYNVALAKLVSKDIVYREYVRGFMNLQSTYDYLHNSSVASTRASLNETNISYLSIVIPPMELLERFNNIANNIICKILQLKDENEDLSAQREFLLPLLMNGQVGFEEK